MRLSVLAKSFSYLVPFYDIHARTSQRNRFESLTLKTKVKYLLISPKTGTRTYTDDVHMCAKIGASRFSRLFPVTLSDFQTYINTHTHYASSHVHLKNVESNWNLVSLKVHFLQSWCSCRFACNRESGNPHSCHRLNDTEWHCFWLTNAVLKAALCKNHETSTAQ